MNLYNYRATVNRCLDGDTLDCNIDLGFNIFTNIRIRLLGIDAFETRTKDKVEKAKGLAVKHRLEEHLARFKYIYLKTSFDQTFNRWLAEVFIDEGFQHCLNEDIAKWMIEITNGNADPAGPGPGINI